MINCPDCKKDVSDKASSCIHCGRPLKKDIIAQPTAGSSEAVKKGRQRSKLRNDVGNAIALLGIIIAVPAVVAGSFAIGIVVAFVFIGIGIWIAYGS
ncbi:MAG: hypothetical protein HN379_12790 [Desulfobacteraceae bacterium]|nr:hypothetical protein [Desulfobacteraceae bacterium]